MSIFKKIKASIPNFITCLNLFCGCVGVVAAIKGLPGLAAIMIGSAAVLDFLDGFMARLLKSYSELGKQLDSLADLVSFGFVPSAILYFFMHKALIHTGTLTGIDHFIYWIFIFSPFLITIFSALRLAKFNIDTRQTTSFIGLPTPANAILIASFPVLWAMSAGGFISSLLINQYFLLGFTLVMSFLLVCEIPMFSLKMKSLGFRENINQYILIISSLVLMIIFQFAALPMIIFLYILISVINNFLTP